MEGLHPRVGVAAAMAAAAGGGGGAGEHEGRTLEALGEHANIVGLYQTIETAKRVMRSVM
jgi:hypothetical protein